MAALPYPGHCSSLWASSLNVQLAPLIKCTSHTAPETYGTDWPFSSVLIRTMRMMTRMRRTMKRMMMMMRVTMLMMMTNLVMMKLRIKPSLLEQSWYGILLLSNYCIVQLRGLYAL